jgi:hypothetical protein
MDYEVVILTAGDDRYEQVIGGLRNDRELLDVMWQAAESQLDERLDKVWVVAVEPATGRALAWCAYQPTTELNAQLKCVNSYERPECWDEDLYGVVYAVRHELIRHSSAVTFVFDEPLQMHLWDGWQPFDDGWSSEPGVPSHHWTGLRREPGRTSPRTAR